MYRIMRNIWIDEARARQRRAKTFAPEEEGENAPDPGDRRIEAAVVLSDVARAMARLPDEQREVIALVLVEGFAYREIGRAHVGTPVTTAHLVCRLLTSHKNYN